jgi:hypothetical protein
MKGNRSMRHLRSRASFGALLSAAALLAGNAVKADIIPVFNVATPTSGGCEFSYSVEIPTNTRVNTGDYFTIYDFNGYIAGSAFAPADWDISVQATGIDVPGQVGITDSAGVDNITFTYVGVATIFGPVNPVGGVGAFGAESINCDTKGLGQYAAFSHKQNPGQPDNNTEQGNQGHLVTPAAIPEASSLMLLVPGLVPLGIMLRRRVRKD